MDETQWGLVNILGPLILGVILVWVVFKARSRRPKRMDDLPEQATHDLYKEEEVRRREGTDGL